MTEGFRYHAAITFGLLLLSLPMTGMPVQAASTDQEPTKNSVKVWQVNIHMLVERKDSQWKEFIDRMTRARLHKHKPDLILVQEIYEGRIGDFLRYLKERTGIAYRRRHAKADDSSPKGSNKMIVWRPGRFKLQTGSNRNDILRWRVLDDCAPSSSQYGGNVIAVRLKDKTTGLTTVAVSTKWKNADECNDDNLVRMNNKIENKGWEQRDLTIVGGDFNDPPEDGEITSQDGETYNAGHERNPGCWYRTFYGPYDNTVDDEGNPDEEGLCPVHEEVDTYYDAVHLHNWTGDQADPEDVEESICNQWTHMHNKGAVDGTSCTDNNDDGSRDKNRIDYLWFRWEDADGEPIDHSFSVAKSLVCEAAADKVNWQKVRYSDHRANHALVLYAPQDCPEEP